MTMFKHDVPLSSPVVLHERIIFTAQGGKEAGRVLQNRNKQARLRIRACAA